MSIKKIITIILGSLVLLEEIFIKTMWILNYLLITVFKKKAFERRPFFY